MLHSPGVMRNRRTATKLNPGFRPPTRLPAACAAEISTPCVFQCFCAAPWDDPTGLGMATTCEQPCAGDASETCGENWVINVYQRAGDGDDGFTGGTQPSAVGCYTDVDTDRIMTSGPFASYTSMTTQVWSRIQRCVRYEGSFPVARAFGAGVGE